MSILHCFLSAGFVLYALSRFLYFFHAFQNILRGIAAFIFDYRRQRHAAAFAAALCRQASLLNTLRHYCLLRRFRPV